MSASLVGSEMCIRDRFQVRTPEAMLHSPQGRLRIEADCRRVKLVTGYWVCLLYTSDAADDM
eukprot:4207250-Alexandrium_andersonii.AAC.1